MRMDRATVLAIGIGLAILAGIVGFSLLGTSDDDPVPAESVGVPTTTACRDWQLLLASADPESTLDDVDEAISYGRAYSAETNDTALDAFQSYVDESTADDLQSFVALVTKLGATPGLADDEYADYLSVAQRTQALARQITGAFGDINSLAQVVINVRHALAATSQLCSPRV